MESENTLSTEVLEEVNADCNQILSAGLTDELEFTNETRHDACGIYRDYKKGEDFTSKTELVFYTLLYIGDAIMFVAKAILALRK